MSVEACAALLERGDPDRFAASMAAPPQMRALLFPLYAFNVEIARAPWITAEPMIAEMRLQWWRDALEEIVAGGTVRRHEVVTPLAEVLDAQACADLDRLIAARRWDIYKDPFEDEAGFWAYLDDTAGTLLWTAARFTGADPGAEPQVRAWGRAQGLANWFLAVPALEAAKRVPLVDGRAEAVAALADTALQALPRKTDAPRAALLPAWQTRAILRQARANPFRVGEGSLGQSEFAKRFGLLRATLTGV